MIKDSSHIAPNVPQWVNEYNPPDSIRRFAGYGIHTLVYPEKDILEAFALRFAQELYQRVLEPPPQAAGEGIKLGEDLLNGINFTRMAVMLARGQRVPLEPPIRPEWRAGFLQLKADFGVGGGRDASFPYEPLLQLEDVVQKTRMFRKVRNIDVMNQCQEEADHYCGKDTDLNQQTVWGWTNVQANRVAERFKDDLIRYVLTLFYDPQSRQPLPLRDKPYSLRVAMDFLATVRDCIGALLQHVEGIQKEYEDVIVKQQESVAKKAKVLQETEADRDAQEEYIGEYQKLMELRVWDIILKAAARLLNTLKEVTDAMWVKVGEPADGWIGYFEVDCYKRLQEKRNAWNTIRAERAKIPMRSYFPIPGGRAEDRLYEALVLDRGLHASLLARMHWDFFCEDKSQLGYSPRQDVEAYKLILSFPEVPGFDKEAYRRSLVHVPTGRYRGLVLSTHSPDETVFYARAELAPLLSSLSIWDAIYAHYRDEWFPVQQAKGLPTDVQTFASQLVKEMNEKAQVFLAHQPAQEGAPQIIPEEYCLSSFLNVPGAAPNSKEALATAFYNEVARTSRANLDSTIPKHVFRINFEFRVPLPNWTYYPTVQSEYFAYLDNPDNRPIHLFPHERNAAMLEEVLVSARLVRNPRCLSVSVVRHLGDLDAFETFVLGYVCGLIPVEEPLDPKEPRRYKVPVSTPIRTTITVDLGPIYHLDQALTEFLKPGNEYVRQAIKDLWLKHVKTLRVQGKDVTQELEQLVQSLSFPPAPPEAPDTIDRDDLKLAMQAVLYRYVQAVRTR